MGKIITYILVFLFLFLFALHQCSGQKMNDEMFLWSVSMVETGGENSLVGQAGERSKYQFMAATWGDYSKMPHQLISDSFYLSEVEIVARKHLNWIKRTLARNNYPVTVENCAAIWNMGWGNFRKGKRPQNYIRKVLTYYRKSYLVANNESNSIQD